MVLLFYVHDYLMFSPSKYKMDELYASLQKYFNLEDDGYLNKYLRIELDCRPDGTIRLRQPYLMEKSSANTTPVEKPPQAKNDGAQARKNTLITDQ